MSVVDHVTLCSDAQMLFQDDISKWEVHDIYIESLAEEDDRSNHNQQSNMLWHVSRLTQHT